MYELLKINAGQAGAPSSSSDTMLSYHTSFQNTSAQTLQATTPNLRSFFGFGLSSVIVDPKLRLLRVIHVQDSSLKNFNKVIGECTHLRYLKLRNCKDVSIPSSVGQLLYLQSIDLRGTELEKVVPNSLWDIPTLKHVYVSKVTPPPARSSLQPTELQTLALNLDSAGTEYPYHAMAAFLERMTRLTSLTLIVNSMPAEMIKIFANMPHLVDLTMYEFHVLDKLPESHHFPQKLQRLCLYARTINEDPLPILQKLPCLVVLVLKGYGGQTMSCSTQGFPELQELELARNFNTEEWRMQFGSMRKLTSLKLRNFSKMKELPQALLHTNLGYLELTSTFLISRQDSTLKELKRRKCKVA
jgi:Leucine-rich repeat (LRR) protein